MLDLYCGAGGCTAGYQRAGFYVIGVDIEPQPNYAGDEFVQADAIEYMNSRVGTIERGGTGPVFDDFDAVHASPPCPAFSRATHYHPGARDNHPDLIPPTRELLKRFGRPYVIENVPGAPIRHDVLLCGEMFGLNLHRHRYFETSFLVMQPPHSMHHLKGAEHNCHIEEGHARQVAGHFADLEGASEAMGIDWMTKDELAQAIPPSYTRFIGDALMAHLGAQTQAA